MRLSLPAGRKTATVGLDGQVIAVAVGFGSVWALDTGSTLYRVDPTQGARHEAHPARRGCGVQHLGRRRSRLGR